MLRAIRTVKLDWTQRGLDYWSPHKPFERQQDFLRYNGREALYGGAGGGGKSDALLMAALQYVHVRGYSALLFRRTYTELSIPTSLMPRLRGWLYGKPGVRWDRETHTWTFPSGATITFGYLQYPIDRERYRSAEFQFIGWDELTQFQEDDYKFLFTRLRKPRELDVPLRMRGATNPGGLGHDWVKARFVDSENTEQRVYFPARIWDNPALDAEQYVESLAETDPITRAQILEGDWEAIDDGLLNYTAISACQANCLWEDGAPYSRKGQYFLGIDVGRTRNLTVLWTLELVGDVLYTREVEVLEKTPFAQQKAEIRQRILDHNVTACRIDQGGIGWQLAEDLEAEFPAIVDGVTLNPSAQGKLGKQLEIAVNNRAIRLPDWDTVRRDFRLVRKVDTKNGLPVLKTGTADIGHADRFWACALAVEAAGPIVPRQPVRGFPQGYKASLDVPAEHAAAMERYYGNGD